MDKDTLGPAERIINAVISYTDHMVHNRPGVVFKDGRTNIGLRWQMATHKMENGEAVVYALSKDGKKNVRTRVGVRQPDMQIMEGGRVVAEYRPAGLFPEVAVWLYRQFAEVWKMDNEFAARWASYVYAEDQRDIKVIAAAFMLCQSRKGDPVLDGGKFAFYDEDFRSVGEAMTLTQRKDKLDLSPKHLLRIHDVLSLPGIAAVNRELGFGKSVRHPFYGRWTKAVTKYLAYREANPKMLAGQVDAAFRQSVIELCRRAGYKPEAAGFFKILRWKQEQAKDGRRTVGIGMAVKEATSWEGLSEAEICEKIVQGRMSYKVISSLIPKGGLTRAILAASIEAGAFSDKDLVIYTPTLEEFGLLEVQEIKTRWERAVKNSDDMRSANIAKRVKSKVVQEKLQEGADIAVQKAVAEVVKGLRVYVIVDRSGSMSIAIETAKTYVAKFLQGIPPENLHVSCFNSQGREVKIPHPSAAGVRNAFEGLQATGGTDHGEGVLALARHKTKDDEDALFIFIGDQQQATTFENKVAASGLNPVAFGFIYTPGTDGTNHRAVEHTATRLGIPCFMINEKTFEDVYAIPRTFRALIAATPVVHKARPVVVERVTLVDKIIRTDVLKKPVWAVA